MAGVERDSVGPAEGLREGGRAGGGMLERRRVTRESEARVHRVPKRAKRGVPGGRNAGWATAAPDAGTEQDGAGTERDRGVLLGVATDY